MKVLKVVCLILFLIIEPINKPKIHNGTKDKDNEKVYLLKIPFSYENFVDFDFNDSLYSIIKSISTISFRYKLQFSRMAK